MPHIPSRRFVAVVVVGLVAATPLRMGPLALGTGSRLWFDGTSTVRKWTCTADRIDATIAAADPQVVQSVLDGRSVTGSVQLDFPVAKLECRNGTMNEHMRKALKASDQPVIRFQLARYELQKDSAVTATVQGTLEMGGTTRPITVPVQLAPAEGGLRVTGAVPVKMTEWGIKPPTLMLGTLKVGESVTVRFDLRLQP